MNDRTKRDSETRDKESRKVTWRPTTHLPDPEPQEGYVFRWIRTSSIGISDPLNVSTRRREGWEPVKAADHPELQIMSDVNAVMSDGIEIGGLMLCKTSRENADARKAYYNNLSETQMEGVENAFLRENDPRMPLLKPMRKTRTTFGSET